MLSILEAPRRSAAIPAHRQRSARPFSGFSLPISIIASSRLLSSSPSLAPPSGPRRRRSSSQTTLPTSHSLFPPLFPFFLARSHRDFLIHHYSEFGSSQFGLAVYTFGVYIPAFGIVTLGQPGPSRGLCRLQHIKDMANPPQTNKTANAIRCKSTSPSLPSNPYGHPSRLCSSSPCTRHV